MTTDTAIKEWQEIPISKLAHFSRGISWSKVEESKDGILVVSIPNIKNGCIDFESKYNHYITKKIPKNKELQIDDIVFVGSSGGLQNVGRNAMVTELPLGVTAFASFAFNARPDKSSVDPFFLYYLCNSSQIPFDRYTKRAADGKYNFQLRDFEKNLKLKVPQIPEQKAIAQILTIVQGAITEQEKRVAKLKELKRSMMQHLFTHGTKGEKTKMTEVGEMPESWGIGRLGDISDISASSITFTQAEVKTGDVVVLGVKVSDMNIPGNEKYLKKAVTTFCFSDTKRLIPPGAIIFPKRGAAIATNKKRISASYCLLDPNLIAIVPKQGLTSNFIFYFFEMFDLSTLTDPGAIPQLNKKDLAPVLLPLPNVDEQQKIVRAISSIENLVEIGTEKLIGYNSLFKTLLHELMSGERRIKVETDNIHI